MSDLIQRALITRIEVLEREKDEQQMRAVRSEMEWGNVARAVYYPEALPEDADSIKVIAELKRRGIGSNTIEELKRRGIGNGKVGE